jgi:hypothetical protein
VDVDPVSAGLAGGGRLRPRELLPLAALWIVAGLVTWLLTRGIVVPRRYIDEFLYWAVAKNFAHGEGLSWRGVPIPLRAWLYPVVIAPLFRLAGSVPSQYELVKAVNSVVICAVVFPAYAAARLFVARRLALLAAVFAVVVPANNYAAIVGTESLAYPLCTAAFAAMLWALGRPGAHSAWLSVVLVGLAALTRMQFAILVPVFAGSLVLVVALQGRSGWRAHLRERRALGLLLAGVVLLGMLGLIWQGRGAVGIYGGIFSGVALTAGHLWFWAKAYAADVFLLCAIVPAIATFALAGSRANRRDPLIGALVVVALVAALALVLQMAWFSSISPFDWRRQHIFYERYMFYLGPLFFTGLVASFGRVSVRAAALSTLAAALVVSGMQSDLIAVPFSIDAFGQAYLGFYFDQHEAALGHAGVLLAALTLLLGGCYVLAQLGEPLRDLARWGRALSVVLPMFVLVITLAKAWSYSEIYAESAALQTPRPHAFAAPPDGPRAGMLLAQDADPTTFYNIEFWNPRVDRVFVTARAPVGLPVVYSPTCRFVWNRTGAILPGRADQPACGPPPSSWVVVGGSLSLRLRDEVRRVTPRAGQPVTLLGVDGPPRIFALTGGRDVRTGRVTTSLDVVSFLRTPGRMRVVAETGRDAVRLRPDGVPALTVRPHSRAVLSLPVGALERHTRIAVDPDGAGVRVTAVELLEDGRYRSAL